MASVELASAYISLVPSAKGISAAIESEMGAPLTAAARKSGEDTGGAFSDGFKRHAKLIAVAAIAGIGAFAKVSVDAASDMAESVGKTNVVFGDSADEVKEWGKTSAKAFGLSNQQALEAAGTYGNLFQAFGLGRTESTKFSKSLVETAADLASFNNTSVDDALIALRSGLSGETEPLKRFGVAINDARLKEEALKLGLIKTTKDALTPAAKAQAAYSLIMHDTTLAQGDFARTSGGLANQQRILEAQTNDLKVSIGEGLLPAKLAVVKFLNEKGIPAFEAFGGKLVDVYNNVKTLAESTIGKWLTDIKGGFNDAKQAFDEFNKTGEWEAHGTFETLGVAAAISLDAIKTKFGEAKTGFEQFQNDDWVAHGTFEKLGAVAATVVDGVTKGFQEIIGGVQAMGKAFIDGDDDITSSGLAGHLEEVGVKARNLFDYLRENKDTLVPIVAGLVGFGVALVAIHKASTGVAVVKTAFSALGPAVGEALAPLLSNPVGLIIAGVVALGIAAYMLYTKFKPFRDVIDTIGRTIRDVAIPVWHALQDAFMAVSSFITGTLIPTITSIWDTIVSALTPLAKWLDENVISTIRSVVEAVMTWIDRMIDAWKLIWKIVEPQLKLLLQGIEAAFSIIKGFFQAFVDVALPILLTAWDLIKAPVQIAFDAIKAIVETVLGIIRGIFQIFKGILSGDFGKIWEGFKTLVMTPFNAIKDFIGEVFNIIWDLIKGLPDRLNGIWKGVWDGLKDIASGIWDGITGMFGGLLEFLRPVINFLIGALNLIITGVNAVISGINDISPFADIGKIDHIAEWKATHDTTPTHIGAGTHFAEGGWVPGPIGAPMLATLHGGEFVVSNAMQANAGRSGTPVVVNISTMMGNPQEIWRLLEPVLRNYHVIV